MDIPDFRAVPDIDPETVTLADDFHDLMHTLPECIRARGDWRRHIRVAWVYLWADALRRKTLCRIGRHTVTQALYTDHGSGQSTRLECYACLRPLSDFQPL